MSAAMTAASAVASVTAGRAAGRPRANAKVRLRPVPPRTHLRARFGSLALFAIRREMFGGAARAARSLTARPPPRRVSRRARSRDDPRRARKTASAGRSERPPSACARAIAEPYALGPVRRWLDVHDRPRSPPLRASRDPADPPPPPRKQAARPVRKSVATAALSEPSLGMVRPPREPRAAPRAAFAADISAVSRLRAHTRKMPFRERGFTWRVKKKKRDAPNTHQTKTRPPRRVPRRAKGARDAVESAFSRAFERIPDC